MGVVRSYAPRPATVAATAATYQTTRGQRAELRLADGTHVILGPDSHLETSIDQAGARTVRGAEAERRDTDCGQEMLQAH